jgi:FdhE protein
VAGEFLRRWFGWSAGAAPEVREALDELSRLGDARPELVELVLLFTEVLPRLYEEPIREVPPALSREQAKAKLAGGVPLLHGEALALDQGAFRRRWRHTCRAVHSFDGAELAAGLRDGRLMADDLVHAILNGRCAEALARAGEQGLNVALLGIVLRLTLYPVFSHVRAMLDPLRAGISWERGYCPVCGAWPLLGEYRGLEQVRFLRCELCAAAWEFPRLACPLCGTRDHRQLGYLHVEGEESTCRAATCDRCRGYVKMVSTLTEPSALRLLVADAATNHLDLAAGARGFARPSLPG